MNCQTKDFHNAIRAVSLVVLFASCTVAQTKATGELLFARQATVNGVEAVSGMTIFSNNRVRTTSHGMAIINLGKLGRIELGADTELALRFSAATVGGDLRSGRATLRTPAGVSLSLSMPKGMITTEGTQASLLTVEAEGEKARVAVQLGAAQVITAGKVERIATGEELALDSSKRSGWERRKLLVAGAFGTGGALAAIGATGAQQAAPVAQKAATFGSLVNTGLDYSIQQLFNQRRIRDPESFFTPSISCRDNDSIFCRRKSGITP